MGLEKASRCFGDALLCRVLFAPRTWPCRVKRGRLQLHVPGGRWWHGAEGLEWPQDVGAAPADG